MYGRQLEVEVDASFDGEGRHLVKGDRQLLKQALVNLVENANLSASESEAAPVRVLLRLRPVDGGAEIAVEDNGPGVPEDRRERVFEPYETTRAHGTGLGLAIVKKLVEAHRGTIDVQSTEGAGTEFELVFPRDPAEEDA